MMDKYKTCTQAQIYVQYVVWAVFEDGPGKMA